MNGGKTEPHSKVVPVDEEKREAEERKLETQQTLNDFPAKVMEINISESAWPATTLRGLR